MDIFYSQKLAVNSFEGATIGQFYGKEYGLICFSKNLLKCYLLKQDGSLLLLYSDYLLENICQLERYSLSEGRDGLVVLFESSKISLISFKKYIPNVESLKYFEKEEYDLRQHDNRFMRIFDYLGISKISKYYFSMFSLNKALLKTSIYRFVDINEKIKNVIDFVFLENFSIPTVCLIYNPRQCSYIHKKEVQAIIFSYDVNKGRFNIQEEFQVPQDTHKILFSRITLAFISNNDIVFRTSNSCYSIGLNKMSQKQEKNPYNIVLNNEKVFFKDKTLIIINGDGSLYKISLKFDSKRIIDLNLKSLGKLATPTFLCYYNDFVYFCSNESSILCKISYEKSNLTKKLNNTNEIENIEDIEFRKLYSDSVSTNIVEEMKLNVVNVFYGMGNVNEMFLQSKDSFLVASEGVENSIFKASRTFKLENEAIKVKNEEFDTLINFDGHIIATGDIKTVEFNEDLQINNQSLFNKDCRTLNLTNREISYQITEENAYFNSHEFNFDKKIKKAESLQVGEEIYIVGLDISNCLWIVDNKLSKIEEILDIKTFSLAENNCYLILKDKLMIYSLVEKKIVSMVDNIFNFEKCYFKNKKMNFEDSYGQESSFGEIFVLNLEGFVYYFVINSYGECAIYIEIGDMLMKVDTSSRYLKFDTKKKIVVSRCEDMLFLNTSNPVMMYLKRNEAHFYNLSNEYCNAIRCKDYLYVLSEEYLYKFVMPKKSLPCVVHSNELVYNPECSCIETKNNVLIYNTMIMDRYSVLRTPKNIVCVENYYVVASAEREKYKPDTNIDQGIDVMTYRYYIDLYSKDFKFITSYQLDPDEYVFDVKYLSLNDTIGRGGRSNFLVVSTTKIEGEDKQSRGRLIVLELTSIVADKEDTHKDKKLKLFAAENIKGCITKCDELKGNIAVCLGIKLMVYKIDRSEGLVPIAIHDLYTLSTSISVIKNYVLVADIYRGLSFFYYQKKPIRLNLLCTSEPINNTRCVDYIIKDSEISFVCTDAEGNFHIYTYSPNNILSEGGTKMIKRYLIKNHLGLLKNRVSFSKFDIPSFISDSNFLISLSGLSSKIYIMLFKLQSQVLTSCKQTFGLNPQNYLNTTDHTSPLSLKKPIVGFLIEKFLDMDISQRRSIIQNADIEENELYSFLDVHFNKIL
ncbi:Protein cft1 [Nosema granulosis]|uniref:Protein cft1 n=1 Tax=Nosema granulosis TaxID=83296 RepID=A0A9P6KYX5_9MICR|nr:Protein cft1 [Nosema granulosis]